MSDCRFTAAKTVAEAVDCLSAAKGDAHLIAGGVALVIMMNEKLLQPSWLIDISRVAELGGIDIGADRRIRIGAAVTHREVAQSAGIAAIYPMLTEMAAEIACGRVMNRGTIGGNICLADPQGDPPVAMLALDAIFRVVGPNGARDVPARAFFEDIYVTALAEDELLQEILIGAPVAHCGTAFGKYAARKAMDYSSTISTAVNLVRDPDGGGIAAIGLGLGGCGVIPVWPEKTEACLRGRPLDEDTFRVMRETLVDEIEPIGDSLYSADYKRHVAAVILKRTLKTAYQRAGEQAE
ncbi:MAG: FAD binding domain-containing protein [Proteobacteria bacterium]|nr:FAD binding domain-containing protein [Pseudomonadota bacterium]